MKALIEKARQAAPFWKKKSIRQRASYLKRLRQEFFKARDQMAHTITDEISKPILQSYMAEVFPSLANLKFLIQKGGQWLEPREEETPFFANATLAKVTFSPYGVVAIIGTWNYPLLLNLSTITEALLAGNTVLFKPSELASDVARELDSLFKKADFPDGVFQTVYGDAKVGQALVKADADKYFFTGSAAVGRSIYTELAARGKPCVLELSGNDPLIARHDAPLSLSVKAAVWGSMMNSGQNCIGAKRLLVHEKIVSDFKTLFLKELKKLVLGPPQNWETDLGPLRREKELLRCEELIQDAVTSGAKILAGGKRAQLNTPGSFFEPTLLEGVTPKMKLWTEDYFGPIALLDSFKTDEEAVAKANLNPFGLGGAIFSKNKKAASTMAAQLECGMVTINEVVWPISLPMLPFGGVKESGFGRSRGLEGLREMVYTKTLFGRSSRNQFRPHYFAPANKWTSKIPKFMGWLYR